MSNYRLSPAAQRDLSSIWDYTEERWDIRQAEIYLREIRAAIERIASDPVRGRACDEIREGYRKLPHGAHVIYYRQASNTGLLIVRILHATMDVDSNIGA